MASNRVLAKSINMPFLQSNNKFIYVSLLVVLSFFLLLDYVPGMHAYSAWVTPPLALFLGLAFALLCGQAHPKFNKKTSKYLLQYSVVGLGFGMNLQASLASGKEGMEFTIISVVGTLLIGWLIGRKFLKVDRDTSYLISSGTAICGGSAIAAVGPVLKAKDSEMSVALGTIFILNAIALFVFPVIGHALNMSQHEKGDHAEHQRGHHVQGDGLDSPQTEIFPRYQDTPCHRADQLGTDHGIHRHVCGRRADARP